MQIFLTVLAVLLALVGLISLGFMIPPRPYRLYPQPTQPGQPAPIRPDLPEPVRRHFVDTLGEAPPNMASAVVWGRGRACVRGVWVPLRFQAWYRPGEAFLRRILVTWFQRPILRGLQSYIRGQGYAEMAGKVESGPFVDQGQVLTLWAEMIWSPAFLVQDPSVRWETVDENTARLVIETGDVKEYLLAHFDEQTGRMTHFSGMRYAHEEEEGVYVKVPWRVDLLEWKEFQEGEARLLLPCYIAVAQGESGSPNSYWTVDGVAYNVDVTDQLK